MRRFGVGSGNFFQKETIAVQKILGDSSLKSDVFSLYPAKKPFLPQVFSLFSLPPPAFSSLFHTPLFTSPASAFICLFSFSQLPTLFRLLLCRLPSLSITLKTNDSGAFALRFLSATLGKLSVLSMSSCCWILNIVVSVREAAAFSKCFAVHLKCDKFENSN